MPELYALGASAPHYFSKCAIAQKKPAGWQSVPAPDLPHVHVLHATSSGTGVHLLTLNSGALATTTDFTTYVSYDLDQNQTFFHKVAWRDRFVGVGFKRNGLNQEQAHVFTSDTAFDSYSWQARFAVNDSYSAFTNISATPDQGWIAVGHAESLTRSLFVTGTTLGTWNQITLPTNVQGGLWSVATNSQRVWIGGQGWVATAEIQNLSTWTRTNLSVPHAVTHVQIVNGQVIALAGDSLFYSTNLFDYAQVQVPGRCFTSAHVHDQKVYVGSQSLLTQQDVFVWDTNQKILTGEQSLVHAQVFLTV